MPHCGLPPDPRHRALRRPPLERGRRRPQLCLTDFGLALDSGFELADGERSFLDRHWCYDYGEVLASAGLVLLGMVRALPPEARSRIEATCGLAPRAAPHHAVSALLAHVEVLHRDGDLPLEEGFVELLMRYRDVIVFMATFLSELQANHRKDTRYDDDALRQLLRTAAFPHDLRATARVRR